MKAKAITTAKFLTSAADVRGYPKTTLPEIGIVGRSNSGKSSLINALANQKLARVSQTPGKTELLNFYEMDQRFILVDMPGYGYAARSHGVREAWTPMIEDYLQNRENLRGVVLVMDIHRKWSEDEQNLVNWLAQFSLPTIVAFNKIDKLNQKEMSAKKKEFGRIADLSAMEFISVKDRIGIEELLRTVFEKLIQA